MSKKRQTAKALVLDPDQQKPVASTMQDLLEDATETGGKTPTRVQFVQHIFVRRMLMTFLNIGSLAMLAYGVSLVLQTGGWSFADIGLFVCVMLSAPWMILGFWNSLIGLLLHLFHPRLMEAVTPHDVVKTEHDAVTSRVAVAMAIRNEDVESTMNRMIAMRESVDATGFGDRFDFHILSDSDDPDVIAAESKAFERARKAIAGTGESDYRLRTDNSGYKAGNLREFVLRRGDDYDLLIPLDADSLMSGDAMVRLVRIMQHFPKLGILQSMAVGAPSHSPFGRVFQFGMRHGMRAFTLGSAWWQADCGPYWGHNAAIRIKPFRDNCHLPELPGSAPLGGTILSHDQVEATFMRRAGYEVRVLTSDMESYEENPVTLLDFAKREQRWCNGNMQYFSLLGEKKLLPVSRFQLVQAIMMYLGSPAWMLMTALAAFKSMDPNADFFNVTLALSIFFVMFFIGITPKIVGALYVALEDGGVAKYGGAARFSVSLFIELLFGMLLAPVMALHLTLFIVGLFVGRTMGWKGQVRDSYGLSWKRACQAFWPQTIFGSSLLTIFIVFAPSVIIWAMPVLTGLIFAIPFAVLTAHPALGRFMERTNLFAIPEDVQPSPVQSRFWSLDQATRTS